MNNLLRVPLFVGKTLLDGIEAIGDLFLLCGQALKGAFLPRYRPKLFLDQLLFVGVKSLPIVMLTGAFSGMVFALQSIRVFARFNVETMAGATVTLALTRELAPVLTGLMVAGRVGSAMATEIGTMRVTEQVDALVALAVDPVQYLVSPRVIACMLMVPLLVVYFDVVGVGGAWLVGVGMYGVDEGFFFNHMERMVSLSDVMQGVIKGAVFGVVISAIACRQGFRATGGARGVGNATTSAVVWSSVAILALNYTMTQLFF
jgi:phospholipid/cholesterol/gamma-HCH transport system permease protein